MKQKKAHASHTLGNRTVIGIICIVVALAICFGIAPLVNRLSDGKTKIVRLTRDISAGATITEADIEVADVGSYNLPTGVIKDKAQVVGKCALSNLTKGDYLFPSKIGNDTNNAGRMLESLDEKDYPNLKTVFLCLDHDSAGIEGCYRLAESIHAIGEYSIWRKSPRNKDWDEDLKERAGRDCIPSSEHPKLGFITEACDDLSACNVGLDPDLASFSRFPNDIVEDGLTKLKLLYRQNEPYTMAKVCLAICYYRDRMIGQEQEFSQYVRQMQAIYRPHRDTESAGLLGDNIRKQLFALEKELKKTGAVTAVEQNIQNRKLLTLGLDWLPPECRAVCRTEDCSVR